MTKLSWKAVRRGDIYCAPACGGNCTWSAYQSAKRSAARIVKKLGTGWKPYVQENTGWHYSVKSADGYTSVYRYNDYKRKSGYWASIGGMWMGEGKTPLAAVKHAASKARAQMEHIAKMLLGIEGKPRRNRVAS
jgi:hypothetical protein